MIKNENITLGGKVLQFGFGVCIGILLWLVTLYVLIFIF